MSRRQLLISFKLAFALLSLAAITTQLNYQLEHRHSIVNFFSFFTIESNLLAAAILLMSAYFLQQKRKADTEFEALRGATALYMTMTGIIYSLFLVGADVQTPLPWVNAVLHYIFPVVVLLDWLIDPPKHKISTKTTWLWLTFPIAYLAYSLIRGPLAGDWYPYPFLNVAQHGYAEVILSSLVIAAGVVPLALFIAELPRLVGSKR